MKIAIIGTRGIPNNYGGFEQFSEYLSVGLVQLGHEVFVYNSHNHPYKKSRWNKVNIIHCFDPEYLIGTSGQFIYDLICIINCRKHDFDIVLQLGYTSSSIWNRIMPKKAILVTNMDGIEWKRSKFSKKVQKFLQYAESLAVKYSDYFIADSIGIQQYLQEEYKVESIYIPYGAELMSEPSSNILNFFNLKKYNYDIVIARMEPENNIEMIINGYLDSKKERDLVIIGNLETKFGKYISEKYNDNSIKYLGFVSGIENLNSFRNFSNLYFHGHSVGGTNPSLLEAMASNSLICAHDNVFNKSILNKDGYYFNSSSEITEFINLIRKDKNKKDKLMSNRDKIKTIYSWDRIINSYNNFFKRISIDDNL
jgi:glycosyltransferase involved in cell wall biosynthesis